MSPDPTLGSTWEDLAPQLLTSSGAYFDSMVYVRNYLPPYSRDYYESVIVGDNQLARTWVGDPQPYSDGFTIEAWGAGAYIEVMEASQARETNGILTLRVPSVSGGGGGDEYSVIFDMPPMSRATPRREGSVQVFTVDVENVKVIGHASL
jgi:hypothetical protein